MQQESGAFSLERTLSVLRRRAPWIILCVIIAASAAFGFSRRQTKQYTAIASLVFNNQQLSQQLAGLQPVGSNNPQAQQNTNLKLVQLGEMAEKTAHMIGHGLTKEKVSADLSVSAQGESNIVDVAATAPSPVLAANIANTYTNQFVEEQQNSNHKYYASALALVERQLRELSPRARSGTAGLALQDRAQSLGVLAELKNGNVQVAQAAAVPKSPSSPKVAKDTALGVVLGLLLGLTLAFLLERLDRRIREPKDLEAIYGLPLLGVVPESTELSRSGRRKREAQASQSNTAEAFHLIRAHLRYFNVDRDLHTLLVASAAPGDGKTTIARHLATAAARMGSRVLLLEADLRRPTIAQQFDIRSGPGLADALIGAVSLAEATQIVSLEVPSGGTLRRERTLDVLVAGATLPPNPGELTESQAMESLLTQAKSTYDLVVIDTPPLTAVSDAFPLLRKVDGVVIVGRVGRNRRDVAQRLNETLASTGAPLLGVIANGFKSHGVGSYSYSYDYSNTQQAPVTAEAATNGIPASSPSPGDPVSTTKN
jgi:capsular exopolysaccharide synthesis family protein